ncbi:hypothetical protein [Yanghanlia caeni]|uniref:Uncharacterized protein n=1 Tax=Yanghanlia caeni TaxID=3064283 RepID=A0ABU1D5Y2_9BURK|nr:hypothetical protein [Alcaligenaceae bacterium LG-2]NGR07976.1 hypothetical protein [bacterium SGD-2]HZH56778.1 hypothetical protein [Burkholderiaceae bacterium]
MKNDLKYYRDTPLGQQLGVHFKNRDALRRSIPLFSFSLSGIRKKLEADTQRNDRDLQHA